MVLTRLYLFYTRLPPLLSVPQYSLLLFHQWDFSWDMSAQNTDVSQPPLQLRMIKLPNSMWARMLYVSIWGAQKDSCYRDSGQRFLILPGILAWPPSWSTKAASGWPSEAERELIPEDLEGNGYQPNTVCTWTSAEMGSNFILFMLMLSGEFLLWLPNLILLTCQVLKLTSR